MSLLILMRFPPGWANYSFGGYLCGVCRPCGMFAKLSAALHVRRPCGQTMFSKLSIPAPTRPAHASRSMPSRAQCHEPNFTSSKSRPIKHQAQGVEIVDGHEKFKASNPPSKRHRSHVCTSSELPAAKHIFCVQLVWRCFVPPLLSFDFSMPYFIPGTGCSLPNTRSHHSNKRLQIGHKTTQQSNQRQRAPSGSALLLQLLKGVRLTC